MSKHSDAAIVPGRAILAELEAGYPVSFSRKIVRRVIRGERRSRRLLVTDDLMTGAARNRVRAPGAGADPLPIAFDHDKYFDAMHGAQQVARRGALVLAMLERSSARRLQPFR